ncbi:hypothetical protein [Streptomyces sp. Ncost-T6T-1]|uniref:hypothetical protein n=1 Tax=Streptomyces sp. Ncost-T6T-1 TaxID=1100828 RepID=UPI000B8247A0|nr:hypothetical protein [Streptomyces sp. Ncost-T6T-1]
MTDRVPRAGRSSVSEWVSPRFSRATSRTRLASTANEHSTVSKMSGSGQKAIVVPVSVAGPAAAGGASATPRAYSWTRRTPPRRTSAVRRLDMTVAAQGPTP